MTESTTASVDLIVEEAITLHRADQRQTHHEGTCSGGGAARVALRVLHREPAHRRSEGCAEHRQEGLGRQGASASAAKMAARAEKPSNVAAGCLWSVRCSAKTAKPIAITASTAPTRPRRRNDFGTGVVSVRMAATGGIFEARPAGTMALTTVTIRPIP